jgi:outer membrane protein OmpA-like peptidoglycan-associated protein
MAPIEESVSFSNSEEAVQRLWAMLIDLNIEEYAAQKQRRETALEDSIQTSSQPSNPDIPDPDAPSLEAPCSDIPDLDNQPQVYPTIRPSTPSSLSNYLPELLTALQLQQMDCRVEDLEYQLGNSEALMNLLQPWIAELLHRKVIESQDTPTEIALAIAPTMGEAIKTQVEIEPDKIVDALYPVIGNTIGKYMAETIQAINQQLEDTLSIEGITRKIRAKVQGVSEAELLLREAMPFQVQAAFLIHKTSGLVIAEVQAKLETSIGTETTMEADMLAGMLTAIRSFANDCIAQTGTVSELDAINYGTAKIILEVAGYCYLAVVVEGNPPASFQKQLRQLLSQMLKSHGKAIKQFEGDPDTIPAAVHTALAELTCGSKSAQASGKPSPLMLIGLAILGAITIPSGYFYYRNSAITQVETAALTALAATPELSVYNLTAKVQKLHQRQLSLTGRVPNLPLQQQAAQVAQQAVPNWTVQNQVVAIDLPPDPVLVLAEVERVTQALNRADGIAISTQYAGDRVTIQGTVSRVVDVQTVTQAFSQIPGVKAVASAVQVQALRLETRFYFEPNSMTLNAPDPIFKIPEVLAFSNQHPNKALKIIGYGGLNGEHNSKDSDNGVGLGRARAVQAALIEQGLDPRRLQIVGSTDLPPGVDASQPLWLSRAVVVELISQ